MRVSFWNPFSTYCMACAGVLLVYSLGYSSLYPALTLEVGIFIAFAAAGALFFGLLVTRTPVTANRIPFRCAHDGLIAVALVAGYAIEFLHFGGIPLVRALSGAEVDYQAFGIPTFHVVLIGTSYFFCVYWWDCYLETRNKGYLLISSIGIIASVLMVGRGGILILSLSFMFAFGNRIGMHKRVKSLGFVLLAVVLGFGYLGNARMGEAGANFILTIGGANEAFAESGLPDSAFWFYLYVSQPLANLQFTELHKPSDVVQWIGVAADFLPDFVSKHVVTPERLNDIWIMQVHPALTVGTAYARPLMALGWAGAYALHVVFLFFSYAVISFARGSRYYGALLAMLCAVGCLMWFDNMLVFAGTLTPILVGLCLVVMRRVRVVRIHG